jgi:hypothetical protein
MSTLRVLDHGSVTLRNIAGPTRRSEDFTFNEAGEVIERDLRPFDADDIDPANAARLSFEQSKQG